MSCVVHEYLDLLDLQREAAFSVLDGLSESQVWQRPAGKEWSIGELLDHNYLLIGSTLPYVKVAWKFQQQWAGKLRSRPFETTIQDPYRKPSFPMWVGFLWKPRYTPRNPVPLAELKAENRDLHAAVRAFYAPKDPQLLGHAFVYDPLFGWINLIVTLRIGIYHDQLHFEDMIRLARKLLHA